MKYRILCIAALLCLLLTGTALANSWGAPGDTASIFMDTPDYKEAVCLAEDYQRGEMTVHMVIGERYYNRLIVAEKENKRQPWRVVASPMTAVYQPDSGRRADITREADGFTLRYGSDTYRFREERYGSEELYLYLSEAHVDGMTFDMEKYMVSQDGESSKWLANISLGDFCIDLMPRSLEEIRRMNRAFILLGGTYTQVLRRGAEVQLTDGSKQPVYSAPDAGSFRAAKGKAAVSLKDRQGLFLLGRIPGWDIIQYKVSNRTSRIGYIETGHISDTVWDERTFYPIDGVVLADSYLTDDPSVSQYHQAELSAGQPVRALGCYNSFYAYVEAQADGRTIRGFMPLRDLDIPMEEVPEVAAQLVGEYYYYAGGGMVQWDELTLHADGTFTATWYLEDSETPNIETGAWQVLRYHPEQGLFWYGGDLAFTMLHADGRYVYCSLALDEEGFSLGDIEGSGGYRRMEYRDEEEREGNG